MAENIRINLDLTGEQTTSRGLKNVGDAADRAGSELKGMGDDAGFLRKKISEADAEVKRLIRTFDETGDLDLLKSIKKEQGQMRLLERLLPKPEAIREEAQKVGQEAGLTLSKSLTEVIMASKGLVVPPLVAAVAAATPAIGAAMSSAVLGGVGAGGLIGGIALAAQDQRVRDAGTAFAETAASGFQTAATPFVAPVVAALEEMGRAADDAASDMQQGFTSLSTIVLPVTRGLIGFVDEVIPGVVKGMEASKPIFRALGNELPKIGRAISDMIGTIAEDSDGAVMAVIALSQAIQSTVRVTGDLVANLSSAYEWMVRTGASASEEWEAAFGWLPVAGTAIHNASNRLREQRDAFDKAKDASGEFTGSNQDLAKSQLEAARATEEAKRELQELKDVMDELADRTMSFDEAQLRYAEVLRSSRDELKEGKRTLDIYTEAGAENMKTVLERIGVIERMRDVEADSVLGLDVANQRYTDRVKLLRDELIAMGYNKAMVEEITARYLAIPEARTIKLNLEAGGSAAAWAAFRAMERQGQGTIDARVLRVEGRASGGPVEPHRLYKVNETGVEYLMTGSQGGYVLNANQTSAMMSGAAGGAQWGGQPVVVIRTGDARLDALLELLDLRVEMALDREATLAGAGPR